MDNKPLCDELMDAARHSEQSFQIIHKLESVRSGKSGIEILVQWDGLPDLCEKTWEPASQLKKDISQLFQDFVDTYRGPPKLWTGLKTVASS